MIRIAYLIDTISCDTAGTEKQLIETIQRLDKIKFLPVLVCLYKSAWMENHKLPCQCFVLDYNGFFSLSFPLVLIKLRKLILENRFHIIQTFFEDSIFVAWLASFYSRQKIILISSRRDMGLGKKNRPWYHQLFGLILLFINLRFDGIIANSKQVKKYVIYRERTLSDKIHVLYNGVEISISPNRIPKIFIDKPAKIWVAVVASLTPVKRHDLLIMALALLKSTITTQSARVIILGDGVEKDNLLSLAEKEDVKDIIHFAGAVHNVSDYLQHVDIGVLCSDREGLSNAILEYMACSLPVVATAVGGNIELVDATNGRCVPSNSPIALSDALAELINNKALRAEMGKASRKKVERYFSWQSSMHKLERYYQNLLSEKRIINDI